MELNTKLYSSSSSNVYKHCSNPTRYNVSTVSAEHSQTITCQEALYRQQDGPNVVQRWPLLLENVQTNVAAAVHIRMIARRLKFHRRRFVRIAARKFQNQFVRETVVYLAHAKCAQLCVYFGKVSFMQNNYGVSRRRRPTNKHNNSSIITSTPLILSADVRHEMCLQQEWCQSNNDVTVLLCCLCYGEWADCIIPRGGRCKRCRGSKHKRHEYRVSKARLLQRD